ncbi:ORF1105 [White spot syndrome virus]|uniref:ORF1105 n=1 Tax=White spot syndrome virus TaxID=342409 RepID=A0A2D3I685_9VIRU|nr:ORF1105 [White spot syndrome virus]
MHKSSHKKRRPRVTFILLVACSLECLNSVMILVYTVIKVKVNMSAIRVNMHSNSLSGLEYSLASIMALCFALLKLPP